jgi:hypothetical protein
MRGVGSIMVLAAAGMASVGCGGGGGSGGAAGSGGAIAGSAGRAGAGGSAGSAGRAGASGGGGAAGNAAGQSGGGHGGSQVDGGAPDVPLSTGTFPYPGRWWGTLSGGATDAGASVDKVQLVLHWSETDPADRNLWTVSGVYPVAVDGASDGSTTLLTGAPETSACWSIYPTADAHTLQVQPCNQPPAAGTPPLGFLNDVPRLLAEIPVPPLGPLSNRLVTVSAGTTGAADGGGDWVAFLIGNELWYWRADAGQVFALGQSVSGETAASPDGRWLLFFGYDSDPGEQFPSLFALDTMTGMSTKIAESLVAPSAFGYASLATFSPDSRRAAFYANATGPSQADLLAYDFATGQTTTLAPHAYSDFSADSTVAFLASGDRVVFAAYDATKSFSTGSIPTYAYDFTTGDTMSIGTAMTLTPLPGRAYFALQTLTNALTGAGQIMLLHDEAGFAPQVLANVSAPSGVWPDPTGQRVAYLTTGGVLNVRGVAAGSTPATSSGDTIAMDLALEPPPAEDVAPSRPVAAWFTGGGDIVHQVLGNDTYELQDDHPTGPSTTPFDISESSTFSVMTALGDVVLTSGDSAMALAWPHAPVTLTAPGSGITQEYQTIYVFSANDRYLTYQMNGDLMVYDFAGATGTQLTQLLVPSRVVTSPVSGVSIVWRDSGTPMNAYAPDGTSWALPGPGSAPLMNPSGTAAAFSGNGVDVLRLQSGATPVVVGDGQPLAITDTQVIFRDLDGVCAVPLPSP